MKTVLITGVKGQDGSLLTDKYLSEGWKVVGVDMWEPTGIYHNLINAFGNENFFFESGDISESEFIYRLFKKYEPELVYNMAAISLVPESFKIPHRVLKVNTEAVINFLEVIREYYPNTKFLQASTSEQLGYNKEVPQNTDSKMLPNSPYAVSKLASYHFVRLYRTAYNIFAVNSMCWNHEGTRRGKNFVTRKITMAVAKIMLGKQEFIELGNLDAYRDWGNAEDFIEAMILMMNAENPDDYAVNTGEAHSIREFVEEAFKYVGLKITWSGVGTEEVGKDQHGIVRIKINEKYYRPNEVEYLCGDNFKIKALLGWTPTTKFKELVRIMVENDIRELKE